MARARLALRFGLLLVPASLLAQQQDFSKVEITTTHVAGSVYMLQGAGGNIAVSAGPDGLLMVDDQFAPLSEKIRAAVAKLAPGKLRFVLNTHWHGDHTGGNPVFGREAPIIAHDNVRKRLSTAQHLFGRTIEPLPEEGWPVITFDSSLRVHFNGEEIRVLHYPSGHTDGDSVIHFTGSNVVHMGDHFFNGRFPFVDLDSGGDVEGMARNVAEILAKLPPGAKIIPGHGALAGAAELREFHRMLVASIGTVRAGMAEGRSLVEIQKAGLPEEWAGWGGGFVPADRWIEIVHRSLSRSGAGGSAR